MTSVVTDEVARTGAPTAGLTALAVGLLGAGLAVLLLARRPRRGRHARR